MNKDYRLIRILRLITKFKLKTQDLHGESWEETTVRRRRLDNKLTETQVTSLSVFLYEDVFDKLCVIIKVEIIIYYNNGNGRT